MESIVAKAVDFFAASIPGWRTLLTAGPAGLAWAYGCLALAGWLKRERQWRTGYTRKVFHFLIFTSVAAIHFLWGTPAVCLFGGMTSLVVFYAVARGSGHPLYEAMAREKDSPHRTYYIVAPYFATLIGGLASNILFGHIAVAGYLVAGLGDAIGEPVGTRFGRHTYTVPSFRGIRATRSWEGTAAVAVMSLVAVGLAVAMSPQLPASRHVAFALPVIAMASAAVEAVSPHGWDNATMQIVPAWLMSSMI